MAIISLFCLEPSDWIAIANILVTITIGVWIGYFIQNNFTNNRAVKEYFISENHDIKAKYNHFMHDIYCGNLSSSTIKEWLKIMTTKIDIYEDFLKKEFIINPSVLKIHNEIKYFITGVEEINEQFKSKTIILNPLTKIELLRLHKDFSISLTSMIIDINKAKRK